MATIREDIDLRADPATVWAAVRDVGAPHTRLTPGVLTDAYLDGAGARVVTFAGGAVVREVIVSVDEVARRVAYASVSGPLGLRHHSASMEVLAAGTGSRLVWTTDLLPDEAAGPVRALVERGAAAIRRTLDPVT